MTDVVDRKTRSRMMAGIGPANTKPEVQIRRLLHRAGFRFRLHVRDLPGRPDIVLPRHRTAIFVNGCFWHRHENCRYCTSPATNIAFWEKKFAANVERDARKEKQLIDDGWRVLVIWECAVKSRRDDETLQARLAKWIASKRRQGVIS